MKVVFFANTDWYLYNFRRDLARAVVDAGHELLLVSPDGLYGPKLVSEGFEWKAIRLSRSGLNPFAELLSIVQLFRLLRTHAPDLLHSFTLKSVIYGSVAAWFARVPLRVHAVAGLGYVFTSDSLKARLMRPLLRFALKSLLRRYFAADVSRLVCAMKGKWETDMVESWCSGFRV